MLVAQTDRKPETSVIAAVNGHEEKNAAGDKSGLSYCTGKYYRPLEYDGNGDRIHAQTSPSDLVAIASPRKLFPPGFEGQSQLKLQTNHSVLHVC